MIGQILIALAAGCASAAMFASITSGALISLVLLYLSPLPLMVAAIGWGPLSAAVGGGLAAIALGATFGAGNLIGYAIAIALPSWWLGHLCLLGRPAAGNASGATAPASAMEWYPIGRILLWSAGLAALAISAALLTLGTDAKTIAGTLHDYFLRVLASNDVSAGPDLELLVDAIVGFVPLAAAMMATLTYALNLWLAGKVAATSGRLSRPWPDLKAIALPPMTLVLLCLVLALCFSGGLPAVLAKIAASVLLVAYGLTGFAVLHTLTLALKSRPLWLGSAYAFVLAFGWPILAMSALGLADAVFGLRQRYLRSRPPPLPVP
jgi:hypothetical protein